MTYRARVFPSLLATALLSLLTGCAAVPEGLINAAQAPPGWQWVLCPGGSPQGDTTAVIGAAGGTLQHRSGHLLVVPPGAVSQNHTFSIREPASPQVMVFADVRPNVTFQQPVTLTVSYARCATQPTGNLAIFRVNQGGQHDNVGGEPGPAPQRLSARLNRLSYYALATN